MAKHHFSQSVGDAPTSTLVWRVVDANLPTSERVILSVRTDCNEIFKDSFIVIRSMNLLHRWELVNGTGFARSLQNLTCMEPQTWQELNDHVATLLLRVLAIEGTQSAIPQIVYLGEVMIIPKERPIARVCSRHRTKYSAWAGPEIEIDGIPSFLMATVVYVVVPLYLTWVFRARRES